jgi:hypothetical protein
MIRQDDAQTLRELTREIDELRNRLIGALGLIPTPSGDLVFYRTIVISFDKDEIRKDPVGNIMNARDELQKSILPDSPEVFSMLRALRNKIERQEELKQKVTQKNISTL